MAYGIKLKTTEGYTWLYNLHEYQSKPYKVFLEFDTISEAEEYAQNYEFNNYLIEVINDTTASEQKRLLT